jgi:hypothetical protein
MLSTKDRRTEIEALDFWFEPTWDQRIRASNNGGEDFRFRTSLKGLE